MLNPAYVLLLLGVVGSILCYFLIPQESLKWVMVIPLGMAAGAYMLRRAIAEWWYTRYPQKLDKQEVSILERFFPYYGSLSDEDKVRFQQRAFVFAQQKDYQMRGMDEVPGDIQLLITATAIRLTWGFDNKQFVLPKLGVIVLFPKTFITPEVNTQLHAGEFFKDDFNAILIAINASIDGLNKPKQFYNIALHCLAVALQDELGIADETILAQLTVGEEAAEARLCRLRNFEEGFLKRYLALEEPQWFGRCVEHFFEIPDTLKSEEPKLYGFIAEVLAAV